ncbi:hypothetical protein J2Z60_001102 [Lactobacillus colini]|uniref:DUF4417 domain-containing protein n=1 Tax=Lactobacillus colini TaxID=1819254 RepID=A0ABS4ME03_9LACO|nr:hypothetical protein [Lactobacillus colini]
MLSLKDAYFIGKDEYPVLKPQNKDMAIPFQMVRFSDRKDASLNDTIVFYEWDKKFESNLQESKLERIIPSLKKAGSVVQPDFSIYADAPLHLQKHAVFEKNRVAVELQSQGIEVIPNLSWGDERSYEFAFLGIPKDQICAMGTYGQIHDPEKRKLFKDGLGIALDIVQPRLVLVYGGIPDDIFGQYKDKVEFISYPTWRELYAKKAC